MGHEPQPVENEFEKWPILGLTPCTTESSGTMDRPRNDEYKSVSQAAGLNLSSHSEKERQKGHSGLRLSLYRCLPHRPKPNLSPLQGQLQVKQRKQPYY